MKIGYSTWGMPTLPVEIALAHLAGLGFDGVELTVIPGYSTELDTLDFAERRRLRQLLNLHGLDLPAVAAHQPLLAKEEEVHAESWRRLAASADLCVDLAGADGVPVLNTTLGSDPNEWNSQQDLILERVGALVDYCSAREVVLAIEPHVVDGLNTPERSIWLLEEIGSPYLKLNFDISHFEVQGMPTGEVIQLLAPHSAHTHVKDQRGIVPDYEFLIPGEGTLRFRGVPQLDAEGWIQRLRHRRSQYAGARAVGLRSFGGGGIDVSHLGQCLPRSGNHPVSILSLRKQKPLELVTQR